MNTKLLILCVLSLLGLTACNQTKNTPSGQAATGSTNIAYINVDSLMQNYQFAIDLNEEFTKKQENMTADLNVKAKKVEDMIKSFQYRLQNNGFASRERAEKEQRKVEKKRQELIELDQTLKTELAKEYQKITERLQDTIITALKRFNSKAGYDLILRTTDGGNVLLGNPNLNITEAFVKQINDAYSGKAEEAKDITDEAKK